MGIANIVHMGPLGSDAGCVSGAKCVGAKLTASSKRVRLWFQGPAGTWTSW